MALSIGIGVIADVSIGASRQADNSVEIAKLESEINILADGDVLLANKYKTAKDNLCDIRETIKAKKMLMYHYQGNTTKYNEYANKDVCVFY